MNFKFSKDSGDSQSEEVPGDKKNQSALLVILLILVGGFTYLYFFTDLIKPQETATTVEAPAPEPQIVKIPLPPREGEPAKPGDTAPEKTVAPKAAASVPNTTAAPTAKPAAAPTKPVPVSAVITAPPQTPAKQKEEPQKTEATKPSDKKPLPVPVADKKGNKAAARVEAKIPADDVVKPAVADKISVPAIDRAKKPASGNQVKSAAVVKAKKTAHDSWSLIVGNYVLEEALSNDMGRIRKAGFEPIVKTSVRKKSTMNRLFVSEFNDRASAQSTMDKLKRHTSDAFVIEHGGSFTVYAGSYLQSESASSEKNRLKAAGFTVAVKHTDIAIPSQSLSVGPFKSKKAADAALVRLKNAGIKATSSHN